MRKRADSIKGWCKCPLYSHFTFTLTIAHLVTAKASPLQVPIPDSVRFAEKKPPCPVGPLVDSVRLSTNMWFLQQQRKTIYKYHVEFRGIHELADGRRQLVHFTRRSADE